MQIRGVFTILLNNGRAEVRFYLYLNLIFIADHIKEFPNRNVARRPGFDVVFSQSKSDQELQPNGLNGIWAIPLAKIDDPAKQRAAGGGFDENMAILQNLEKDFPCLSLQILYQREVKQASGGLDREGRRRSAEQIMWADVDKVSLHEVAAHMLLELVSAK